MPTHTVHVDEFRKLCIKKSDILDIYTVSSPVSPPSNHRLTPTLAILPSPSHFDKFHIKLRLVAISQSNIFELSLKVINVRIDLRLDHISQHV